MIGALFNLTDRDGQTEPAKPNLPPVPPLPANLQATLQAIVDDVVYSMGCVGGMVATLENGNMLPVRAVRFNIPNPLVEQLTSFAGVNPIGAESVAYLDDRRYRQNLSVRAVIGKQGKPEKCVLSDRLYDLFRPIISEGLADQIQSWVGIKQVVAVPFFLENEVVGNLFAASAELFSERDIEFLIAFGHQAAAALQSQRNLSQLQALERVVFTLQRSMTDETQALQTIVDAVVHHLGYAGAMVATLESDNSLPVRAYAVDLNLDLLRKLEKRLGVTFVGPHAMVYLDDPRYHNNLSVRAVQGDNGRPIRYLLSNSLHDLFRPIVNRPLSALAQRVTGIKQVVAVPFFLEDHVVGNLFVASRKVSFSPWEIQLLTSFGQQAAIAIHNARLYRKSEERRQIAQMFARMAFSASTAVHALRNHLGVASSHLQLLQMWPRIPPEKREQLLNNSGMVLDRLHEAAKILDNLHEPWRQSQDSLIDINDCLNWAAREVLPPTYNETVPPALTIHKDLGGALTPVSASADMMTELFRIIIKNGLEAVLEQGGQGEIWITSYQPTPDSLEVRILDTGVGIQPKNLQRIFEMGWSTKKGQGMGFGLFWAKDYIEGLGGAIQVESVSGKGTTFIIRLPVTS